METVKEATPRTSPSFFQLLLTHLAASNPGWPPKREEYSITSWINLGF
jgi:hypothetical protein